MSALADGYGVDLTIGRVFGLIGPDQRPDYLVPGLIRRVRTDDLASVLGLDYVRDYSDTRDVSRHLASLALLTSDGPQRGATLVNVCSGEETRIGDLLDQLLSLVYGGDPDALEEARGRVGAAPGRPTDISWSVGDPSVLADLIDGPVRSIPIAETLAEALVAESN